MKLALPAYVKNADRLVTLHHAGADGTSTGLCRLRPVVRQGRGESLFQSRWRVRLRQKNSVPYKVWQVCLVVPTADDDRDPIMHAAMHDHLAGFVSQQSIENGDVRLALLEKVESLRAVEGRPNGVVTHITEPIAHFFSDDPFVLDNQYVHSSIPTQG
jgi:hypothetical protein